MRVQPEKKTGALRKYHIKIKRGTGGAYRGQSSGGEREHAKGRESGKKRDGAATSGVLRMHRLRTGSYKNRSRELRKIRPAKYKTT